MKTDINFISHLSKFFLELEIFQTKFVEKTRTRILCSLTFFFFSENRAFYDIMWKNMLQPDRPQMTV